MAYVKAYVILAFLLSLAPAPAAHGDAPQSTVTVYYRANPSHVRESELARIRAAEAQVVAAGGFGRAEGVQIGEYYSAARGRASRLPARSMVTNTLYQYLQRQLGLVQDIIAAYPECHTIPPASAFAVEGNPVVATSRSWDPQIYGRQSLPIRCTPRRQITVSLSYSPAGFHHIQVHVEGFIDGEERMLRDRHSISADGVITSAPRNRVRTTGLSVVRRRDGTVVEGGARLRGRPQSLSVEEAQATGEDASGAAEDPGPPMIPNP